MAEHVPVMLDEVIEVLSPKPGETAVDCTAGLGGHGSALAKAIGPDGHLILNDLDAQNVERARERVLAMPDPPKVTAVCGNFARLPKRLAELEIAADVLLADFGIASNQLDASERGFSFGRDGPLDMRLDPTSGVTAADLVNTLSERELGEMIRDFGEERFAKAIARKIVARRAEEPFERTEQLAGLVRATVRGHSRIDPATRTFQALRIAVNDEMGNLEALLEHTERGGRLVGSGRPGWLAPGARIAFISFHSLEDRPTKQALNAMVDQGLAQLVVKGVLRPDQAEVDRNPRSRSAKLRAVRLVGAG